MGVDADRMARGEWSLDAAVTVGPGVSIGRNSVIGAGSVVLSDIADHVVAAGSPAKVVRTTAAEDGPPETCIGGKGR